MSASQKFAERMNQSGGGAVRENAAIRPAIHASQKQIENAADMRVVIITVQAFGQKAVEGNRVNQILQIVGVRAHFRFQSRAFKSILAPVQLV